MGDQQYPKQRLLREGAVAGFLAHAVSSARYPDFSHEQSWAEGNYSVQDSQGSRGTISFSDSGFVGVFFSIESDRNPFSEGRRNDWNPFLEGICSDLRALAISDALQYVLQDYDGNATPIITTAFWSDSPGDRITAAEAWDDVLEHGAALIAKQTLELEEALPLWQEELSLTDEETNLVRSLSTRRLDSGVSPITLSEQESKLLVKTAAGGEGISASEALLAQICVFPEPGRSSGS